MDNEKATTNKVLPSEGNNEDDLAAVELNDTDLDAPNSGQT